MFGAALALESLGALGLVVGAGALYASEGPGTQTIEGHSFPTAADHGGSGTLATVAFLAVVATLIDLGQGVPVVRESRSPWSMDAPSLSATWNGRDVPLALDDVGAGRSASFSVAQVVQARKDARERADEAEARAQAEAREWERGRPAREEAERARLAELEEEHQREMLAQKKAEAEEAKKEKARRKRLGNASEVSASELLAVYHGNEVAADGLYQGHRLAVTGYVIQVGKDIMNRAYISLGDGNSYFSVHCDLGWNLQPEIARLSPGQTVVVAGKLTGMTLGSPFLSGCELVEYSAR